MVLDDPFDDIDRRLEDVQAKLDTCRQAELLSRAAVIAGLGVLCLVLTFATSYRTPTIVFGSLTAVIGGLVWLGANRSSRQEAEDERDALERKKAGLIDQVAVRNGWRDMTPTVH